MVRRRLFLSESTWEGWPTCGHVSHSIDDNVIQWHEKTRLAYLPSFSYQVGRIHQYVSLPWQREDCHFTTPIIGRNHKAEPGIGDEYLPECDTDGVDDLIDSVTIGFTCSEPSRIGAIKDACVNWLIRVIGREGRYQLLGPVKAGCDPLSLSIVEFLDALHKRLSKPPNL
jgi:hypothetical protein